MPGTRVEQRAAARRSRGARPRGRSRPHELTFWPSSVSSRTPSPARRSASATSSAAGPRLLAPAHGRHDAVRARRVAALRDLQPGLERPLAAHRQVAGELVERREVPARHVAAGLDELAEARDVAGAVGEVDERVQLEQLVLDRLRPAAADHDHLGRVALLGGARVHQARVEALVGLLADRAGVEHEHVGVLGRRRLAQPERLEQALHALGVVDVHLAAERGDAVAAHRGKSRRPLRAGACDRLPGAPEHDRRDHDQRAHRVARVERLVEADVRRDRAAERDEVEAERRDGRAHAREHGGPGERAEARRDEARERQRAEAARVQGVHRISAHDLDQRRAAAPRRRRRARPRTRSRPTAARPAGAATRCRPRTAARRPASAASGRSACSPGPAVTKPAITASPARPIANAARRRPPTCSRTTRLPTRPITIGSSPRTSAGSAPPTRVIA